MSPTTFDMIMPTRPRPKRSTDIYRKNYLDTYAKRRISGERTQLAIAANRTITDVLPYTPTQPNKTKSSLLIADTTASFYEDIPTKLQAPTASAQHIRTIIMSAILCGVLATGLYSTLPRQNSPNQAVVQASSRHASPTETVRQIKGSAPLQFSAGEIKINAPIEQLSTTAKGAIDVPKSWNVVGWYDKSSLIGAPGPAVLVGHYSAGQGAVFDNLQTLNKGSRITITSKDNTQHTYVVTKIAQYSKGEVPMHQILKQSTNSRLEIITCAGTWDSSTYDKRLVVTAELII
jgi:sortase A